ncbi:MerR family transcriptional regulator [Psychrobacter sp. 72-O-c]|uniref:MerR family transcriptional regulator n=1 Tax=Psychrobacter sp. 72-O-c TaxID=2774125 RepID=UPI001919503D|nr:MerR family transcriptional regulator [Psychrobacter sp. 72-O-c]
MAPDNSFLLIGTLATQANTTKDTVRHYDQLGLLKSRKRQAGSRLYTEFHPECIERIELIKSAQAIGFNLNEVKNCLNDYYDGTLDIDKQISIISEKLAQTKRQQVNLINVINELNARRAVLEDMKSDNTNILSKGEWDERLMEQLLDETNSV